jgi:hypothetical protein
MRSSATGGVLAVAGGPALTLVACSSGNGDGSAERHPATAPRQGSGCAAAAGLSGPMEDRGMAEASGGAITLDASEFAFSPTCVEASGGQSLEVTVTDSGSALHNLSVGSLGIHANEMQGAFLTG